MKDKNMWFPSEMNGQLKEDQTVFDKRLSVTKHVNDKYPSTAYFVAGS